MAVGSLDVCGHRTVHVLMFKSVSSVLYEFWCCGSRLHFTLKSQKELNRFSGLRSFSLKFFKKALLSKLPRLNLLEQCLPFNRFVLKGLASFTESKNA